MAIGWIAALKLVPWDQVVRNAPRIVAGAQELLKKVGTGKSGEAAAMRRPRPLSRNPEGGSEAEQRLIYLEASLEDLQEEMRASAEMVKALAEQNIALVEAGALLRRRLRQLTGVTIVLAVGVGGLLVTLKV